jgi:hypothetical protein
LHVQEYVNLCVDVSHVAFRWNFFRSWNCYPGFETWSLLSNEIRTLCHVCKYFLFRIVSIVKLSWWWFVPLCHVCKYFLRSGSCRTVQS